MQPRELKGSLPCLAFLLQEYDFGIIYAPGKTIVVPDALSRGPVMVVEQEAAEMTDPVIKRHQQPSSPCSKRKAAGERGGMATRER